MDPCRLEPVASINRVRLGGREARELLSAPGLVALARAHGLRPEGPVRTFLDASPDGPAVADEYGLRLGRLLVALRTGDRVARPEWDPSWWAAWAAIETVRLGGGLAGGAFGRRVAARAAERAGCRVTVAPEPGDLPLLGAATKAPPGALVLDFGHTHVKRALTIPTPHARAAPQDADAGGGPRGVDAGGGPRGVDAGGGPRGVDAGGGPRGVDAGGGVRGVDAGGGPRGAGAGGGVRRLAVVAAPREDAAGPEVAAAVAATIAAARAEAGHPPGPVVAAMAAYIRDGQPVRTPLGMYARLADVTADVPGWLADRVGVPVTLVHDGTAAAHALPPDPRSAVILLGTSLGIGFPHPCPP